MDDTPVTNTDTSARWLLARDIGVLQLKLIVDGLRDLVLVPASLIAGAVSLFSSRDQVPGDQFYQLLALGKQSEHWINLFGALENAPADLKQATPSAKGDIDELVQRLENFVIDEHKRGGITAQAKNRFDKAFNAFQDRRKSSS